MTYIATTVLSIVTTVTYFSIFFPEFIQNFTTHIPGRIESEPRLIDGFWGGDHWQVFYLSWKMLFNWEHGLNLLHDPLTFASAQAPNADLEIGLQFAFVALFMKIIGATAGYNFAFLLLPKALTFLTAWFLCRQTTTDRMFIFLGAFTLFLLPQTLHQTSWGHSGGAIFWLVPLGAAFVWRHAQSKVVKRFSDDWKAGLVIFILVHADQHQSFYLLMLSALAILLYAVNMRLKECQPYVVVVKQTARNWRGLIIMIMASMMFGMILDKILMTDASSGGSSAARTFGEIRHYSRPIWEFIRLDSDVLFPWLVLFALAVALLQTRKENFRLEFHQKLFVFGGCGFSILMLGMGQKGDILAEIISLPYRVLYYVLPYFNYQRVPDKMAPIAATLVLAVLLSLVAKLRHPFMKSIIATALLVQITVYLWQGATTFTGMALERTTTLPQDLIDAVQSDVSEQEIVLPLPTYFDGRAATFSFAFAYATERRSAEGYHGFPPAHYVQSEESRKLLEKQIWNEQVLTYLKTNGITHLLIDFVVLEQKLGPAAPARESWISLTQLQTVFCSESACLFRINS
jgi:hypothetical protein